jgi:HlyD family secretion protein
MQQVDLSKATYYSALATVAAAKAAVTQAEAQVNQKEGAVAVARTNLEYTVIRSPIDGTVVARNVDVGQTVAASLQAPTLFTIAKDLTKMQVYAKTDETNVGKVKVGRRVTFKVDAFPKDTFQGVVSQVRMNPVIVQNVVNYDAIIDFDNPELKLFPGMTAYVTVPVASAENVLKIANGALRYMPQLSQEQMSAFQERFGAKPNERTVVWKLRADNTMEPVKVTLGITDHSYTALGQVVIGELREGDNIITGEVPVKNQVAGAPAAGGPPRR